MDIEIAKYIVNYYSDLLNGQLGMGLKHTISLFHSDRKESWTNITQIYRKYGWITEDENESDLLKDGEDSFYILIASRILSENKDKIFLNLCPQCQKLARTPFAKQCKHCGYDWHE